MNGLIIFLGYLLFWLPVFAMFALEASRGTPVHLEFGSFILLAPLPAAITLHLAGRDLLDAGALWWRPLRRFLPAPKAKTAPVWEEDGLASEALEMMSSYRVSRSLLAILPATLAGIALLVLAAWDKGWPVTVGAMIFPFLGWFGARIVAGYVEGRLTGRPWRAAWGRVRFPLLLGTLTLAFAGGYLALWAIFPLSFGKTGSGINGILALAVYAGVWAVMGTLVRQAWIWSRSRA